MRKYDCNRVEDYVHEITRMCMSMGEECVNCPISLIGSCELFDITSSHIKAVQRWSDTHPENAVTLTARELDILKSLRSLGCKWIALCGNRVIGFEYHPRKEDGIWKKDYGDVVSASILSELESFLRECGTDGLLNITELLADESKKF